MLIQWTLSFFGQALNNTSEQSEVSLFSVALRSFTSVQDDRFAKKISLGSTAILLLLFLWNNIDVSTLTALRALETAHARCKSSSKLGFCSLTRSFHLSVFRFFIGISYIRLYVPPKQVLWFIPYPGTYHILELRACFSVILTL